MPVRLAELNLGEGQHMLSKWIDTQFEIAQELYAIGKRAVAERKAKHNAERMKKRRLKQTFKAGKLDEIKK